MKKVGLIFGTSTAKTARIAEKIQELLGKDNVKSISVEDAWADDFQAYDNIIAGSSTWFDGELPTYWDEIRPELESLNLKGKKVALFGLGDQKKYPDNFVDGIGLLAESFENAGAKIVGLTSVEEYEFAQSKALRNGKFLGLVIDFENQPGKTDGRIAQWVEQLKKEFN